MIQTAAIIWAVLATGLGIAAGIGWWAKCHDFAWAIEGWRRAGAHCDEARACLGDAYSRAWSAENDLRDIKRARHLAAKKARAAQLAQQAALVSAKAEQIRKEIGR